LAYASCTAASATEAEHLIVGSVRDWDGRPIEGASVRATDAAATVVAQGRTDELGTFAMHLSRAAAVLEIRCTHCRSQRVAVTEDTNVAIVVTRYGALESDLPDANDLAALPYGRVVDALGLVPFVLPGAGGASVNDRGLGGGRGLVADDGAALADLATGASALIDFPERSVRHLNVTRANEAFRYGPYAAGGIFTLDTFDDVSVAAVDGGRPSSLALAPVLGTLHPAFAVSSDDGVLARRGDLDLATPFAGGALRLGLTNGDERLGANAPTVARDFAGARLAYATASRLYRTFIDAATNHTVVAESGVTPTNYSSAYSEGGFRLERPGAIGLAAGVRVTQQSASYDRYLPLSSALDGRANSWTTFLEAHVADSRTRVDVGIGSSVVSAQATIRTAAATQRALLPSLGLREALGGGYYARAGFSESLLVPGVLQSAVQSFQTPAAQAARGELLETALGFDAGGRLTAEAIAYREYARGGGDRRLEGVGASIKWQVSPLISLRAWSLRTGALNVLTLPYTATLPASRQVLWASLLSHDALRIDAILHRDVPYGTRGVVALDGDVLVPLRPHLAVDLTTSRRDGLRRYAIGLRGR